MIDPNDDSGTPRDAKCVECDIMFSTILPEWGSDMCEGCISLLTMEASQIEGVSGSVSDLTSQISPPVIIPVTPLSDDTSVGNLIIIYNNHIVL